MASARSHGDAVIQVLAAPSNIGYWQNRRQMEAQSGLTRCEFAVGVKYARDVLVDEYKLPPLVTRPGEVAICTSARQYRDSRLWEFSYNASRVGTAHNGARSAVRKFRGQQNSTVLESDAKLLKLATACLRAVKELPYEPDDAQILRAASRISGLKPEHPLPNDLTIVFK